jgi:hypothetical protein
MIFRTADLTKWGAGKGGDLTPTEVDLNFWEVLSRIVALEGDTGAVGIDHFATNTTTGTITVFMTDGTQRGPYALPAAKFRLLGEWTPDTVYPDGVFITEGGDTYIINVAHTSALTFDPGATDGSGNQLYGLLPFAKDRTYDVGFFYPGTPGEGLPADSTMFARAFSRDVYFPAGLTGSVALMAVGPAITRSFLIYKNTTEIGFATFAPDATEGTFSFVFNVQFNSGDVLRVTRGPSLDSTAFDLSMNFAGVKGTP